MSHVQSGRVLFLCLLKLVTEKNTARAQSTWTKCVPSAAGVSFATPVQSSCPVRKMAASSDCHILKRLQGVEGLPELQNDVIYSKVPADKDSFSGSVVFFGGDVQDFPEKMLAHRDNRRYVAWNLEATAKIISHRFPGADIWVVLPSKRILQILSVYSNFLTFDDLGNPENSEGQNSWRHLASLLQNLRKQVDCSPGGSTEIRVVGFSKGCVVLNQLLYDLGSAREDVDLVSFVSNVKALYWLDGGHNGGSNTWITDENVLKNLVGLDLEVFSHVTPYQVKDTMRKWIGKEQRKFVEKLKKVGVKVTNTLHFEDEDRCLENHFQVLNKF